MRVIISLLFFVLAVGCSTTSVPLVQKTYAPQVDFSQLKTFSWQAGSSNETMTGRYQQTLRTAVQTALETKGVSYTESASDFLVATSLTVEKKIITIEDGSNLKTGVRSSSAEPMAFQVNEGGLSINFYDSKNGQQIFQGTARTEIDDNLSAEKRKEQIVKAVTKILADYPSGK